MVTTHHNGETEFRVYLPHASDVRVVGDFTDWTEAPTPMKRDGDGFWVARVRISAGDYLFSYLVNGQGYLPDYAASGLTRNPFGGWVSCLSIAVESSVRARRISRDVRCAGRSTWTHNNSPSREPFSVEINTKIDSADLELVSGAR